MKARRFELMKLKLLMVSPFFPNATSGACTRSYHLLKALAREYTVSLLVLTDAKRNKSEGDDPVQGIKLQQFVQIAAPKTSRRMKRVKQVIWILQGKSPLLESYHLEAVQQALDALFLNEHYDVVLFEGALMAADYQLPHYTQVIIDEHDIEYELLYRTYLREKSLFRKWYNWWESRRVKPVELRRCSHARGVLVTSERESLLLKSSLTNSRVIVVPNGVDIEFFCQNKDRHDHADRIIFTGAMDSYPNIDAVLYFAMECWPLILLKKPSVTWQIVGKNPPSSVVKLGKLAGITVTGSVPDVRPYLAAATVAIAPLRIGSGTRLKILEALAMKKAVVSTSLGCEGLDVVPGRHLIMVDQPEAFAQCVVDLLQDQEKRAALGGAGREFARAYSWQRIGDALVNAVEAITTETGV